MSENRIGVRWRLGMIMVACAAVLAAGCSCECAEVQPSSGQAADTPASPRTDPGEQADSDDSPTDPDDSPTDPDDSPTDPDDDPTDPDERAANIFDDPRDGIFDEHQASMDRGDHPFMQIDAFCTAHDPAPDRRATDEGIEADTISLVHMRSQLENLEQIGFAVDVGDPREMFETFATVVNEQCGGVRGRKLVMHTLEHDPLSPEVETDQNLDCIEATEDLHGVILLNSSGFQGSAALCIVEDHETAFITVQPQPEEFVRRGEGRLVSTTLTAEQSLRWLALDLLRRGELDGKTIGVAAQDTPGQYEAVKTGLVDVLREHGANVAVFDQLGCGGTIICMDGAVESAGRMRSAGVDVVFNVLSAVTAPQFLNEMINQGFEPGDVQFYATDFNSQARELVAEKIVSFGSEAAGALYNGAIILDSADTGSYRIEGYQPRAFNEMCNETYGANSPSGVTAAGGLGFSFIGGASHESDDRFDGNARYGMVNIVCEVMRMALRALYDAGDNPTRADVYAALANLGAVDTIEMIPGSIRPGKLSIPDAYHTLVFEFPCSKLFPFGAENVCIYPVDEFRPPPA